MSATSVLPPLSQRVRAMLEIDPQAPAIAFEGRTFPWGYYADAVRGLEAALADAGSRGRAPRRRRAAEQPAAPRFADRDRRDRTDDRDVEPVPRR